MNIPKAIKVLDNFEDPLRLYSVTERKQAAKLGIEALKELKELRLTQIWGDWKPLPGETED